MEPLRNTDTMHILYTIQAIKSTLRISCFLFLFSLSAPLRKDILSFHILQKEIKGQDTSPIFKMPTPFEEFFIST